MASNPSADPDIDQYELRECLGAGSFGRVHRAYHKETHE